MDDLLVEDGYKHDGCHQHHPTDVVNFNRQLFESAQNTVDEDELIQSFLAQNLQFMYFLTLRNFVVSASTSEGVGDGVRPPV
jgi:hypothetical protein